MSKSKYQCYINTNKIFGKKIIKVLQKKGYLENGNVLLSEEDLDNIDNDNEGDGDVHESSSDNKKIKKKLKNKEVQVLSGRTIM